MPVHERDVGGGGRKGIPCALRDSSVRLRFGRMMPLEGDPAPSTAYAHESEPHDRLSFMDTVFQARGPLKFGNATPIRSLERLAACSCSCMVVVLEPPSRSEARCVQRKHRADASE